MPAIGRRPTSEQLKFVLSSVDPAAEVDRVVVYAKPGGVITQVTARLADGAFYVLTPKISTGFWFRDDLVNRIVSDFTVGGTGANGNPASDQSHIGTVQQSVAAFAVDFTRIAVGNVNAAPFLFGGGSWEFEGLSRIVTLSNGVNNIVTRWGFGDSTGVADHTDGAYLEYDLATHGDNNYRLCAANNGARTKVDTGITAVAGLETHYQINVNAAGTLVTATINGAASANSVATNIPTGAGRSFNGELMAVKQLGAGTLTVVHDFYEIRCDLTVAR